MSGRIIGMISCILCAVPFWIIGYYNKNSREPIPFWSGDKSLKEKVKDIQGYNAKMSRLYIRCALAFAAAGVICLIHLGLGISVLLLECTFGIYVVWRIYKNILQQHFDEKGNRK